MWDRTFAISAHALPTIRHDDTLCVFSNNVTHYQQSPKSAMLTPFVYSTMTSSITNSPQNPPCWHPLCILQWRHQLPTVPQIRHVDTLCVFYNDVTHYQQSAKSAMLTPFVYSTMTLPLSNNLQNPSCWHPLCIQWRRHFNSNSPQNLPNWNLYQIPMRAYGWQTGNMTNSPCK